MTHDDSYTFPLNVMPTASERPQPAVTTRARSERNETSWRLATSGDLALLPLRTLLTAIRRERATGVLTLLSTAGTARIQLRDGRPVAAKLGRLSGAEAMDEIRHIQSGLFHLRETESKSSTTHRPRAHSQPRRQRRREWAQTPLRIHQPDMRDSNVILLPATRGLLNRFRDGHTIEECVASGDIRQEEVAALMSLMDVGVLRPDLSADAGA